MKNSFFLFSLMVTVLFCSQNAMAIEPMSTISIKEQGYNGIPSEVLEKILSLSPKEFEKMTGHHLNLKDRVAFKIMKWKMKWKHFTAPETADSKYDRMGKWSLLSGIGAFVIGLVPGLAVLSIPAAILAIVLGAISIKKARKRGYSVWGIVLGASFLILLVVVLAVYISLFSFKWV